MKDERIRELMEQVGMPNSLSLFIALNQVANEVAQEWLLKAAGDQAKIKDLAFLVQGLLDHIETQTCTHENTHRGGVLWEICDDCGAKWADDEGGKPPFKWPPIVEHAREVLVWYRP